MLDRGSDPVRGTITKARLDLSNSCLLNVLFTNTELTADVNQMDGGIYLRIPGYFVDPYGMCYRHLLNCVHVFRYIHIDILCN